MKKIYALFIVCFVAGLAYANGVKIDEIYYILIDSTHTAKVTYTTTASPTIKTNAYSGDVIIPATVTQDGTTYTVTAIGDSAFFGSAKLTSVYFPESLTKISGSAFWKCTLLTQFSVDPNNAVYSTIDGVLFSKDKTRLVLFPFGRGGEYYVPSSTKKIGGGAFTLNSSIEKVVLPDETDSIVGWSFNESNLKSVEFGKKMKFIGEGAFYFCANLRSIEVPDSIKILENESFRRCSALEKIIFPKTLTEIRGGMFWGCSKLDTVISYAVTPPNLTESHVFFIISPTAKLLVPKESVEKYKHALLWKDFSQITSFSFASNTTLNSTVIEWIQNELATQYVISIFSADTLYAQYVVDGEGNLTDTIKSAAVIGHAPKKKLDSRETFTISIGGLKSNTTYSYSIVGMDDAQQEIYKEEGSFRTKKRKDVVPTELANDSVSVKINYEGHIYILRGEDIYTVQGQRIK